MSGKADTIEEFLKSFSKSYLAISLDSKSNIVHPARIDASKEVSKDSISFRYIVDREGKNELSTEVSWNSGRHTLIRDYPNLGMVKAGPSVGYLEVRPHRQWSKGYYAENVSLNVPNYRDVTSIKPNLMLNPYSRQVIWQIYNREFWTMQKALEEFEKGEHVGFPISSDVAVYLIKDIADPCVAYKNTMVGSVRDGKEIKLLHGFKIFKEHLERCTKMEVIL
jgi:hypothetical protein